MSIEKIKNSVSSRAAAGAVGIAMALTFIGVAGPAQAATLTASQVSSIVLLLQSFGVDAATIANVQATLNGQATTGSSSSGSMSMSCTLTLTRSLMLGSKGADVMGLQQWLNNNGYTVAVSGVGSKGMESMYFGPATKAAVMKFQAANGVSAIGIVGPMTRAKLNAMCTTTTTTTTGTTTGTNGSTGPLTGAGVLTNISTLGDISSTLYAGDPEKAVAGESVQASGGDVQIQRIDATFDMNSSDGSVNLNRYVSDVSLYINGTKVASMDPATGDYSGTAETWTYRFTTINYVVRNGQTANIHIEVTPLTSIGVNENGETVKAEFLADSIRAVGADGISDTYVSTANNNSFTVNSSQTGTLTASPASDNPAASQVQVASTTTTGVKLLAFNLKAQNSGSKITNLEVSLDTSATNVSDVVNTLYLYTGSSCTGSAVSSKTASTGDSNLVTFTNINQMIAQDATQEYSLCTDLKGDSAYADGTTLTASTTVTGWSVQDANGNSVTPSAAVSGNTFTLTGAGISAVLGTPTATVNSGSGISGGQDTGTWAIPFTVTAGNTAVWVGGASVSLNTTAVGGSRTATSFSSDQGIVFATTTTSTATSTSALATSLAAADANSNDANGNYYVAANSSRSLTFNISGGTGQKMGASDVIELGFQLVGVNYSVTSALGTTYYTSNLTSFKTPDIFLRGH